MKKKVCFIVLLLIFGISQIFAAACGDVNGDELVDIVDALLIAQDYVNLNPENYDSSVADVNADSVVDIVDALLVAQFYVVLITELNCEDVPTEEPTPTPEVGEQTYELQAEDENWSSGDVESDHSGYTGTGYVNTDNSSGEWIEWSLDLDTATNAIATFTYACASGARSMKLIVNGTDIVTLTMPASGAWTTWIPTEEAIFSLLAGPNTIRLEATTSDGGPNMDKMDLTIGSSIVTPTPTPSPIPTAVPTTTPVGWTPPPNTKARVIATTDGETDDRSSMVRFLMYAGDFDVEGIVQVNGVQASGHSGDHWIEALIDKYDEVLPNLRVHNPDYPSKEYLLSVLKVGNENSGDRNSPPPEIDGKEGAQLMIDRLLDDDMRLVHILSWGGANTTANALWQIKEHYSAAEWQRAVEKVRVYCIWFQDGGGKWIKTNLPEVKIYGASVDDDGDNNDASWRYVWDYMSVDGYWKGRDSANPQALQDIMDKPWLADHITSGHGSLCAAYGQDYTSEGDTPSFMPCVDNGLEQFKDYTLGGWGGRPVFVANVGNGNYMEDGSDECWSSDSSLCNHGGEDLHYPFQRWLVAAQHDWASHADWCVASTYGEANHQPVVNVAGGAVRDVSPGDVITLDASGSTDPDGNSLSVRWWQYHEADSANTKLVISNDTSMNNASFTVPNEPGKQLHVLCEVTDDGDPPLKRWQRIIFRIN